ncbi:MAG: hypothetical protein D6808_06670 [Candidatus Dadabacteria bacterium]|nr:MAG: hypothetical protein D6808_06670 [Candidatus Dadabacteria bacterium]
MLAIEWLIELERSIEKGERVLACQGIAEKQWAISKDIEELRGIAQRVADAKKMPVKIVSLITVAETMAGDLYLVPTKIDAGHVQRGLSNIQWSIIETRDAAEMMRDVRFGPSPFFGMQTVELVKPTESENEE